MAFIRKFVFALSLLVGLVAHATEIELPSPSEKLYVNRFGGVITDLGLSDVNVHSVIQKNGVILGWDPRFLLPLSAGNLELIRREIDSKLAFVYRRYRDLIGVRPVFTEKFVQELEEETRSLPKERLVFYEFTRGTENEVLALVGIFDGKKSSLSPDSRTPIERFYEDKKTEFKGLKARREGRKVVEIHRIANDPKMKFDIRVMARVIAQHLIFADLEDAVIYVHTDEAGSRYDRMQGFKEVEYASDQLGGNGKYILRQEARDFIDRFYPERWIWSNLDAYSRAKRCGRLFGS